MKLRNPFRWRRCWPRRGLARVQRPPPFAQAKEQFFPVLSYRTGAYAPNGVPWANGYVDYLKLINARGGINGVKIIFEECETGYATDRGVECYERLKGKNGGATLFHPLSTGITFALTEKAPGDKIPLITAGYGRSESADGSVFKWNFPLIGTYWVAADMLVQHIAKKEGGCDKLKGKKIALVYHDSPYGKEPIPLLQERSKMHGFELQLIPVTHPGVEQKAAWLQIRQSRPDYVFLWGWGVMNSTALKEARGHRLSAREDVRRVVGRRRARREGRGRRRQGLQRAGAAARRRAQCQGRQGHPRAGARQGPGHRAEGRGRQRALHARPDRARCSASRACARAQERYGKGKVDDRRAGALGPGEPRARPEEARRARLRRRDAADQHLVRRPHGRDLGAHAHLGRHQVGFTLRLVRRPTTQIIKPMVKAAADKYAAEKKIDAPHAGGLPELSMTVRARVLDQRPGYSPERQAAPGGSRAQRRCEVHR